MNKTERFFSSFTEEQITTVLQEHGSEIAAAVFKHVQTESATLYMRGEDPVKLLPRGLRRKLIHRAAFRRAFEQEYLQVEDGEILSRFKTKTLLAYFCGRVFSDDKPKRMGGITLWGKGDGMFPAKELCEFFGEPNLKEIRKNNLGRKIIAGYEVVDNLFVVKL